MTASLYRSIALLCAAAGSQWATAQCTPTWTGIEAIHSPIAQSFGNPLRDSVFVDRDGAGSHPGYVIIAGDPAYLGSGSTSASTVWELNLATRTWTSLGGGTNGSVDAVAAMPGGDIIVAGDFSSAGGVAASRIARWDGSAWHALGSGITDGFVNVRDLEVAPNGTLVVAGGWWVVGGLFSPSIARWSPTAGWSSISYPYQINDISIRPNGNIVAASTGASPPSQLFPSSLIEWNGTNWSPLGGSFPIATESALVLPNGDVLVSRRDPLAQSVPAQFRLWNGTSWTTLATENGAGKAFVGSDGETYYYDTSRVYRKVGNAWQTYVGYGLNYAAPIPGRSELFAVRGVSFGAGIVTLQGPDPSPTILPRAVPVARGIDSVIESMTTLADGSIVAAGRFTQVGGVASQGVALWNSGEWQDIAPPAGYRFDIPAVAKTPQGNLVAIATASFTGAQAAFVRVGGVWQLAAANVGPGVTNGGGDLTVLRDGRIVSGTTRRLAFWNGSTFAPVSPALLSGGNDSKIHAFELMDDGRLMYGGRLFGTSYGSEHAVWIWDGTTAVPAGYGLRGALLGFVRRPNGDIIAMGNYTHNFLGLGAGPVSRWDGTEWVTFGGTVPTTTQFYFPSGLGLLDDGRVITSWEGKLYTSSGAEWALFDGVQFSPTTATIYPTNGTINFIQTRAGGELVVAGNFRQIAGTTAPYLARLATPVCNQCDSIDFNGDNLFPDDADLVDFLSVLAGGPCNTGTCNDIDFNNDTFFPDDVDLIAFLRVLAGGPC